MSGIISKTRSQIEGVGGGGVVSPVIGRERWGNGIVTSPSHPSKGRRGEICL